MVEQSDSQDGTRELRLNELIARYLSAQSSGNAVNWEAELNDSPDLREDFLAFVSRHRRLARVDDQTATLEMVNVGGDDGHLQADLIGRTLGDCRIVQALGHGGMGIVYLGEHIRVKDFRAVKVLPRSRVTDLAVKRFWREAQTAARINHLNVVTIHDVGRVEDLHYIVMQYVDGRTLVELLELHARRSPGQPLPWHFALQLISPVLDALASVHARGLIHRDVKPSNVMVTGAVSRKMHVVLMDFGLVHDEADSQVTESGAVVGTPAFMSCEQARGLAIDRRSDLYSVGATLYFLLTGQAPFTGKKTDVYLRVAAGERPAPAASLRSDLPPRLVNILDKSMDPDRERRYATAEDMLRDIGVVLRERTLQAAPSIVVPTPEKQGALAATPAAKVPPAAVQRPLPRGQGQEKPVGPLPTRPRSGASVVAAEERKQAAAAHETEPPVDTSWDRLPDVALFELVYPPPSRLTPASSTITKLASSDDLSLDLQQWLLSRWQVVSAASVAVLLLIGALVVAAYVGDADQPALTAAAPTVAPNPEGMVLIPAGEVRVGATENEIRNYAQAIAALRDDSDAIEELLELCIDQPPQTSNIAAFWIDKYEVTNGEYARFVADTGHPPPEQWNSQRPPRGTENHPVTGVTSDDAETYAAWAGKKLPSEAQWIRAYRGDSATMFPWGNDWNETVANTAENNSFLSGTSPVDASPEDRSTLGVFNMVGNATELTRDRLRVNDQMVSVGKGGNSQGLGMYYSLAPARIYLGQDASHAGIGFRCIKEIAR